MLTPVVMNARDEGSEKEELGWGGGGGGGREAREAGGGGGGRGS